MKKDISIMTGEELFFDDSTSIGAKTDLSGRMTYKNKLFIKLIENSYNKYR